MQIFHVEHTVEDHFTSERHVIVSHAVSGILQLLPLPVLFL